MIGKGRYAELKSEVERLDGVLRGDLAGENAPPYLGLLDAPTVLEVAQQFIRLQHDRSNALCKLLAAVPAVGVYVLARLAAENLGTNFGIEFYPHLFAWLGIDKPRPNDAGDIHEAFCKACPHLGLSVERIPKHLIETYLQQSGVTWRMTAPMATAFRKTERVSGLPDYDNTQTCAQWVDRALGRLSAGEVRLRRLLENDQSGYYARTWSRLRRGARPESAFEEQLAEHLTPDGSGSPLAETPEPQAILRDDEIGIVLPAATGSWRLDFGASGETHLTADREDRFWLRSEIPNSVRWALEDASGGVIVAGSLEIVPPEDGSPAFAIFDAGDGSFIKLVSDASGKASPLAAGSYRLLSRFPLYEDDREAYEIRRDLFVLDIEVKGEPTAIVCGGKVFELAAKAHPRISFDGDHIIDRTGVALYAQGNLLLRIDLPPNIVANRLKIVLHPFGTPIHVASTNGTVEVPLSVHLPQASEIVRLRATVIDEDHGRTIASTVGLVALGARSVVDAKFFGSVPTNIDKATCQGIEFSMDGFGMSRAETLTFGKLVILPDPSGTITEPRVLELPRPGARAQLVVYENGQKLVHPLRFGGILPVSLASAVIEIECDDPSAEIIIGDSSRGWPFARRSAFRLSMSALYDLAERGETGVWLAGADGKDLVLRAMLPTEPIGVGLMCDAHRFEIRFSVIEPLDAVRLRVSDLTALEPGDRTVSESRTIAAPPLDEGAYSYSIEIPDDVRRSGTFVCRIEAWPRGAAGWRTLHSPTKGAAIFGGTCLDSAARFGDPRAVLDRIDALVSEPLLPACAVDLAWIDGVWARASRQAALERADVEWQAQLFSIFFPCGPTAKDTLRKSWTPFLSTPHLLCDDGHSVAALVKTTEDPGLRLLSELAGVAAAESVKHWVTEHKRLSHDFCALAFVAASSERRGTFNVGGYAKHLTAAVSQPAPTGSFDPSKGLLLGLEHYRWALQTYAREFAEWLPAFDVVEVRAIFAAANELVDRPHCQIDAALREICGATTRWVPNFPIVVSLGSTAPLGGSIIPTFAAHLALAIRAEFRTPWILGGLLELIQRSPAALRALEIILGPGRDLLVMFLIVWEVALKEAYDA
jgi:hypothetical protein